MADKANVVFVKIRLDGELHEKLKAQADREERSMANIINRAIRLLVEQYGDKE